MKVKIVPDKQIKGYWGMNPRASKELHKKCPKNTILVAKSASKLMRKRTIAHEKIEYYHMGRRLKYKKAHRIAEAFDRRIK